MGKRGRFVALLAVAVAAVSAWSSTSLPSRPNDSRPTAGSVKTDLTDPTAVAYSPDGSVVAVGGTNAGGAGGVVLYDANSLAELGSWSFAGLNTSVGQLAFQPSGSRIYAALGGGSVAVLDVPSKSITANIPLEQSAYGVAVSPDGSTLYVATNQTAISVVDTGTLAVTGQIAVTDPGRRLVVSADGTRLYASYGGGFSVGVIDVASKKWVRDIRLPSALDPSPQSRNLNLALNRTGTRLYASMGPGGLAVIDTAAGVVMATVPTYAEGVASAGEGTLVYVTDAAGNAVEIDAASNAVRYSRFVADGADQLAARPSGNDLWVLSSSGTWRMPTPFRSNSPKAGLVPGKVTQARAVKDGNRITVSWRPPRTDPRVHYWVYDGAGYRCDTASLNCSIRVFPKTKKWRITVVAENERGMGIPVHVPVTRAARPVAVSSPPPPRVPTPPPTPLIKPPQSLS